MRGFHCCIKLNNLSTELTKHLDYPERPLKHEGEKQVLLLVSQRIEKFIKSNLFNLKVKGDGKLTKFKGALKIGFLKSLLCVFSWNDWLEISIEQVNA